jgi:hypothetical protein
MDLGWGRRAGRRRGSRAAAERGVGGRAQEWDAPDRPAAAARSAEPNGAARGRLRVRRRHHALHDRGRRRSRADQGGVRPPRSERRAGRVADRTRRVAGRSRGRGAGEEGRRPAIQLERRHPGGGEPGRGTHRPGRGSGDLPVSADEGLSAKLDSPGGLPPRIHAAARRGLQEELGLEDHEYRLALLGFTIDTERHQWDSVFVAYLHDLTSRDFDARLRRGTKDGRYEFRDREFIPFDTESVLKRLRPGPATRPWTPIAPVAFYLALVHEYGRWRVERAARRFSRGGGWPASPASGG